MRTRFLLLGHQGRELGQLVVGDGLANALEEPHILVGVVAVEQTKKKHVSYLMSVSMYNYNRNLHHQNNGSQQFVGLDQVVNVGSSVFGASQTRTGGANWSEVHFVANPERERKLIF